MVKLISKGTNKAEIIDDNGKTRHLRLQDGKWRYLDLSGKKPQYIEYDI